MFNLKKTLFIKNLKSPEIKYMLKLLQRYNYPKEIKKLIYKFLQINSHEELINFINSQNIFSFSTQIDETTNINVLKEKLAYEINEQLLKLAF
jgi:hypothetical protein